MSERKVIKGFKVFNPDWTCNPGEKPFQYTVGSTYEEDIEPVVGRRGFHFCNRAVDCFRYLPFNPENKVAEVYVLGEVDTDEIKFCTNKIQIIREIPWAEVLEIVNTGKECSGLGNTGDDNNGEWNSGNYNSGCHNSGDNNDGSWNTGNYNRGDMNTGHQNIGNKNTGDQNSGSQNSGHHNSGNHNSGCYNSGNNNSGYFNSGNYNIGHYNGGSYNSGNHNIGDFNSGDWNMTNFSSGCFNTIEQKIYLFDKPSEWTYQDWLNSEACYLLMALPNKNLEYVDIWNMTPEEKVTHPEAKIEGGYLRKADNSEHAVAWWQSLEDEQKNIITSIPNFDKAIFKEMTGIDVDND